MENNLEETLGAILNDPGMMQKIQSMAQSLGHPPSPESGKESGSIPEIDIGTLQKLTGLAGQTGIDKNQHALLCALSPYISQVKVNKLEKAMRAAKIARLASGFLGSGGLQSFLRR